MEVHRFGDRSHPPLVLLHGIGAGHRPWLRQIEHFARTHLVLAPDMSGLTAPAVAPRPDISDIARRLATELSLPALGPDRAVRGFGRRQRRPGRRRAARSLHDIADNF
jgi:pimeloyl-ACP methyl ester carboxylesterase